MHLDWSALTSSPYPVVAFAISRGAAYTYDMGYCHEPIGRISVETRRNSLCLRVPGGDTVELDYRDIQDLISALTVDAVKKEWVEVKPFSEQFPMVIEERTVTIVEKTFRVVCPCCDWERDADSEEMAEAFFRDHVDIH